MASAFTLYGEIKVNTEDLKTDLVKAENALKKTRDEMEKTEKGSRNLRGGTDEAATGLASLASKGTIAVAAVGAVAVAAVQGSRALFNLAKSAADTYKEIGDLGRVSGLSSETISALKFGAESAGASFNTISSSVTKFTDLIGDANDGSKQAIATLTALGVDPVEAANNLEGAIAKVIKEINGYQDPMDKARAATAAFGSQGNEMISVIDAANGKLQNMKDAATEAGAIVGRDAVQAAERFNTSYNRVAAQLNNVAVHIGNVFMPAFEHMLSRVTGGLNANSGAWSAWQSGATRAMQAIMFTASNLANVVSGSLAQVSADLGAIAAADRQAAKWANVVRAGNESGLQPVTFGRRFSVPKISGGGGGGGSRGGGGGGRSAVDIEKEWMQELLSFQKTVTDARIKDTKKLFAEQSIAYSEFYSRIVKMATSHNEQITKLLQDQFDIDAKGKSGKALEILKMKLEAAKIQLADFTLGLIENAEKMEESARFWGMSTDQAAAYATALKSVSTELATINMQGLGLAGRTQEGGSGFDTSGAISSTVAPPPPPYVISQWKQFFATLKIGFRELKESLPSIKQSLTDNLVNGIMGIGDVFANAVANWDGTAKGFFKSLAQGFKQMVQQILAELIRLMVIKAVMNIIGAVAGGSSGGGTSTSSGGGGFGGVFGGGSVGFAAGGASGAMNGLMGGTNTFNNNFAVTINNPQNPKEVQRGVNQSVGQALRTLQKQQSRFR